MCMASIYFQLTLSITLTKPVRQSLQEEDEGELHESGLDSWITDNASTVTQMNLKQMSRPALCKYNFKTYIHAVCGK